MVALQMVTTLILTSEWIRIYGLIKLIENLIFIQKYIFSLLCTISIWIDWLISGGECLVQSILQKVRQIYRITVYWPNHLTYTHIYIYIYIYIYITLRSSRLSEWCCSVSMVWVKIPSREEQKFDSFKI